MEMQDVYYGTLWEHGNGKTPGQPLHIRHRFVWAGREFYIPAVYVCEEGLVIDLCRRVDPKEIRRFADKWNLTPENDNADRFSRAQQMQMEAENPLTMNLNAVAVVNGQKYPMEQSSSTVWNPCLEDDSDNIAAQLVRQYGLHSASGWNLCRACFPYTEGKALSSLSLTLREPPHPLPGPCFSTDGTQTDFVFSFPPDGTQHTLHIEEYRQETLEGTFGDESWEYPRQFTEMIYTLTPDLDSSRFQLHDCSNGDQARRLVQPPPSPLAKKYRLEPTASQAAFVGVIGAGVSSVCVGESAPLHTACSAVHFTQPETVDWMLVYYQQGAADRTVDLGAALIKKEGMKMKPLRKALPALLMVWPYLLIGVLYLFSVLENDTAILLLCLYGVLTAAVYGLNIWNACTLRDEKQLARWSMAVKLVHIPFYLLVFCVGVVFTGAMVVPALLFLSPFILLLLAAGDWLLMMTSSVYGISAAVQAAVRGRIPKADAIVCGVLHCLFVLDVVGAVLLFCRLRKTDAPLSH